MVNMEFEGVFLVHDGGNLGAELTAREHERKYHVVKVHFTTHTNVGAVGSAKSRSTIRVSVDSERGATEGRVAHHSGTNSAVLTLFLALLDHFERNKRSMLIREEMLEDLSTELGRKLGDRGFAGGFELCNRGGRTGDSHTFTLLVNTMGLNLVGEVGGELVDDTVLQLVRKVGKDGSTVGTNIDGSGDSFMVGGSHLLNRLLD